MMDILVNVFALALVAAIIYWFWFSSVKVKKISKQQSVEVLVKDGVYSPARIEVTVGQFFTLCFIRKDATPCAEKVIFDTLDKVLELPLDHQVDLELQINEKGEYAFNCDMQMYRGVIVVK